MREAREEEEDFRAARPTSSAVARLNRSGELSASCLPRSRIAFFIDEVVILKDRLSSLPNLMDSASGISAMLVGRAIDEDEFERLCRFENDEEGEEENAEEDEEEEEEEEEECKERGEGNGGEEGEEGEETEES